MHTSILWLQAKLAARTIQSMYNLEDFLTCEKHNEFIAVREAFIKYFQALDGEWHFDKDKFRALCLPESKKAKNLSIDS